MFGSQPSCLKHVLCPGNAVLAKHIVGPRLPVADWEKESMGDSSLG